MTVVCALIIFCGLIFAHEWGHFILAKKCDVQVHKFALGMGPVLFRKKVGETEYSFRALPIGGFCAMEGELEASKNPRAFTNKKLWQQAIIIAGGPLMNILTALVLMCIIAIWVGAPSTQIESFSEGTNAKAAGLKAGDTIVAVEQTKITKWEEIGDAIADYSVGDSVAITVNRGETEKTISVKLADSSGRAVIGISPSKETDILYSLKRAVIATANLTKDMYDIIKRLITGEASTKDMSGPIGIVYVVHETVQYGFMNVLYLIALISLNLGVFNLLPIPALDGGRLLLMLIRAITRGKLSIKAEYIANTIGMCGMLLLMVYVTFNDISNLIALK